ncbi:hypothetical protein [Thiomicrorhabdus cannonii]|uniref:hypothetical protein n=1 Tax=Thiomicrorhabdus cannonii TaxID=2748011 RepID=UPI0015BABDC2|nr:hypothetical protein [Thiomicrorhabdus cannonii]
MTENTSQLPTETQLNRVIASSWDLQQAQSALTFLLEDIDFDKKYSKVELRRFRCFESQAIVSFARPFVKARRASTLGLKLIGLRLDEKQQVLMDKVIKLRDKIIAHTDEEAMHFRVDIIDTELTKPGDSSSIKIPHIQHIEWLYLSEEELLEIQQLISVIQSAITKFLFPLCQSHPKILEKYQTPSIEF